MRRFHSLAQYAAWGSAGVALSSGFFLILLTSDGANAVMARVQGIGANPTNVVNYFPAVMLIAGFLTIVAAMCGGFRRSL